MTVGWLRIPVGSHRREDCYSLCMLKSTSVSVCCRGISRLPSAFVFLRWFKLAHISIQVCTFHDGCKQGIDQQIFNRKSISRKITHPQSFSNRFCLQRCKISKIRRITAMLMKFRVKKCFSGKNEKIMSNIWERWGVHVVSNNLFGWNEWPFLFSTSLLRRMYRNSAKF